MRVTMLALLLSLSSFAVASQEPPTAGAKKTTPDPQIKR